VFDSDILVSAGGVPTLSKALSELVNENEKLDWTINNVDQSANVQQVQVANGNNNLGKYCARLTYLPFHHTLTSCQYWALSQGPSTEDRTSTRAIS
jgi:hypothetical protein